MLGVVLLVVTDHVVVPVSVDLVEDDLVLLVKDSVNVVVGGQPFSSQEQHHRFFKSDQQTSQHPYAASQSKYSVAVVVLLIVLVLDLVVDVVADVVLPVCVVDVLVAEVWLVLELETVAVTVAVIVVRVLDEVDMLVVDVAVADTVVEEDVVRVVVEQPFFSVAQHHSIFHADQPATVPASQST